MCIDFVFKPGDVVVRRESEDQYTGWIQAGWPKKKELYKLPRSKAEKPVTTGNAGRSTLSRSSGVLSQNELVHVQA